MPVERTIGLASRRDNVEQREVVDVHGGDLVGRNRKTARNSTSAGEKQLEKKVIPLRDNKRRSRCAASGVNWYRDYLPRGSAPPGSNFA